MMVLMLARYSRQCRMGFQPVERQKEFAVLYFVKITRCWESTPRKRNGCRNTHRMGDEGGLRLVL